ncbi:acetyltransferase [Lamprobacter modestohalophilus]|uniref:Acetyltransferase n=1 Tax=Lamprobacter modestohalophilus TaxID=1064514 RepID=A0A9X0W5X1_9GAMM|nr:acyltransferase [Lamprobacter modestohalophilus]MBK1617435.1 acetyltransferase [Lamprobacter modestohalophilus]
MAKNSLKHILRSAALTLMLPLVLLYRMLGVVGDKDALFSAFSQLLSLLPGKTGSYLRVGFYRWVLPVCADSIYIGFGALFAQRETIIEDGVYVGPQCNIGSCRIGKNTLLGSGVHLMSGKGQHCFEDLETPIKDQGGRFDRIVVGEDCWIGNGALVMADIGNGCVVGAGSVVSKPVPEYSIVSGNPAQVLRQRAT